MYIGNPYKVLGVRDDTPLAECKKVYRSLCRKYHPDSGGDADKFDEVQKAYSAIESQEYLNVSLRNKQLTHVSLFSYQVL